MPFPNITEEWFAKYASSDPTQLMRIWERWLAERPRRDRTKYAKILELASGLSASAIGHYLNNRSYKLSESSLRHLDDISHGLGISPPKRPVGEAVRSSRGAKRIALLTELKDIPSPPYHMEVIRSIIRGASDHNFPVAVHEVRPSEFASSVEKILRVFRPDAVIILRLTPDTRTIQILKRSRVPTILIHADRLPSYAPPILANVVPDQRPIQDLLTERVRQLLDSLRAQGHEEGRKSRQILVVYKEREEEHPEFSIRNERIDYVLNALNLFKPEGYEVKEEVVPDYGFRQAFYVFEKHRDAIAYICLSDEIAVGIKHLLQADGREYRRRIIGFDDSELARTERITSFGQHLAELGWLATDRLSRWFSQANGPSAKWPDFEEVLTDVDLAVRD